MSAIFPDFWHPLPNIHSFFSTICQQFWPIFDTSPPTNDRRHLWMAPCWLTGRFCPKFNKQFFCCCYTSLKTAINAICMAWNTTFSVGSSCSLAWLERAQGSNLTPFYRDWSQSEILSEIKLPLAQRQILVFSPRPVREVCSDIFIFCSDHMEQIASWSVFSVTRSSLYQIWKRLGVVMLCFVLFFCNMVCKKRLMLFSLTNWKHEKRKS